MRAGRHVLVVDGEPVYGVGLLGLLAAAGIEGRAVALPDVLEQVPGAGGAVIDASLGRGPYAGELVAALRAANPELAVVVSVDRVRPVGLPEVLEAGARAVVHRQCSPDELVTAVTAALDGRTWLSGPVAQVLREELAAGPAPAGAEALTRRQLDVLRALAAGDSNASIGARLGISENTVRNHVHAVMAKLGAANRTDAVTIAMRLGLVELTP
jgi:DNA-binding NarL/FixJ family response regulator